MCRSAFNLTTIYLCDIPACLTGMNYRYMLFCLASGRVCPLCILLCITVRSYRTFSPLLIPQSCDRGPLVKNESLPELAVIFCGTFHKLTLSYVVMGSIPLFVGTMFIRSPDFPHVNHVYARLSCTPQIFIIKEKHIVTNSIAAIRIIV